MWNLIKMDFYRLFTSKIIKIAVIVSLLMPVAYIFFSLGIIKLSEVALQSDPSVAEGMGFFASQVAWMNGVNFSDIVLGATGTLSLFIGCALSASFIGSEQSSNYLKNYAGQLPDKGYTVISKFVVTSIAQVLIVVIYAIVGAALAYPVFGNYINGYNISALLAAVGLRIVLHLAVNAVIIFICSLTKSHAIAMIAGCIFGLGISRFAYLTASGLLSIAKINFDIANYMPDGVNSQLEISNVATLAPKAILVAIGFIAVFLALNFYVVRKRDVR